MIIMAICPNWSNYLKDYYKFCPNCGTKISKTRTTDSLKVPKETSHIEEDANEYALEAQRLEDLGKYAEALRYWNKTLELGPHNDFYIFCKGFCLKQLELYKDAINWINKAIQLNSNENKYHSGKEMCLERLR